jgi:ribosomal protection tetracycline resistance protein
LAHVDAGKTTLTERLLYAAGVIHEIGTVEAGTTQTDSMELERQRGITIRSAVVSFVIDDVAVNLIDTPGHPDFIAEVERVLSVLDGAILVLSAVEGVQPQTRVLMRALQRLRVPTLLFINKIDRRGADRDRVLAAVSRRISAEIVPMGATIGLGARAARFVPSGPQDRDFRAVLTEVLAGGNDALLAAYVTDETRVTYRRLRAELAAQTRRARVHPVYFGSAVTGAGVAALMSALVELLPTAGGDPGGPVSGRVFKIERGRAGEKMAYVRLFSGTARTRDKLRFGSGDPEKITAIRVFDTGSWVRGGAVHAGEIGQVWGLSRVQVGDIIADAVGEPVQGVGGPAVNGVVGPAVGAGLQAPESYRFPPPTLQTVVAPRHPETRAALRVALAQLAEQDPLINVRQDDTRQEISLSLYGEVQKEVIQATLAADFGVEVTFRESTTLCVERPVGAGEAIEILNADSNPFHAGVGLRVEPAPVDSGVQFRLGVDARTVPIYVFKNVDNFAEAMGQYVRRALREGLYGWPVTDCIVTMIDCNYSVADGPPSQRGPQSTAADYRKLTPLALMLALHRAGTIVCEPMLRAELEIPAAATGPVLTVLASLGAVVRGQTRQDDLSIVDLDLPVARASRLRRQLPGLTSGEGVLDTSFGGYHPVAGDPPTQRRTMANPLHRDEYLTSLGRGRGQV